MRYLGRTEQGEKIRFEVSGGRISEVQSLVQALCIEFGGRNRTKFEFQPFLPAGSFAVEGDGRFSGTEKVGGTTYKVAGALWDSKASGTLDVSYSKVMFDPLNNRSSEFYCSAEVEWNATPLED